MIEQIKSYKIKGNPNNPRVLKNSKFKQLVQSIKDFPEMLKIRPIVVDENLMILGGNMRWKASLDAGLKEIWIYKADNLSEKKKQEFIIKDNVNFGEWNWDLLGNEWDSLQLAEWGLDVWQNNDEIDDIEQIYDFNESVNFIIKCDNLKQLEKLQLKLNTKASKLNLDEFLNKVNL